MLGHIKIALIRIICIWTHEDHCIAISAYADGSNIEWLAGAAA
jgi:hypothetical protein